VTSNDVFQLKIDLADRFRSCGIIQLFIVVFYVVRTVHEIDFRLLIN